MPELNINGERLWGSLMTHGKIGGLENGGVCRKTLTPEDIERRDIFVRWCEKAGMSVATDVLGTIYATQAGTDDSLEPLAIGSHLDTQPSGGKFDGILRVLSGLEVVRALNDAGRQTAPADYHHRLDQRRGQSFPTAHDCQRCLCRYAFNGGCFRFKGCRGSLV